MAVSLGAYGPFDSGAGANMTESGWRVFMARMRGDGNSRSGIIRTGNLCDVYADSSGMQVKMKTGIVWIEGAFGTVATEITLPVTAAHATLTRIDRVVVRNDFVNNRVEADVLPGTAGSGSPPPITTDSTKWEVSAATISIPALDNNIDAAQVTLAKHWQDAPESTAYLTADFTKNNSTTLSSVTDLTIPLSANRAYAIDGSLFYESATAADAKVLLLIPAGATVRLAAPGVATSTAFTAGNFEAAVNTASATSIGGAGAAVPVHAFIRAVVTTVDASGDLVLQWAQDTANVSNTILRSGSWLKAKPLQ